MQIPVPTIEPFVALVGPDPGSELVFPNKSLHYWRFSASIRGMQSEVSPEAVWGDAGTNFPHPDMSVMLFYTLNLPLHRSISL